MFKTVLRIRIRKILVPWIRIRKNMRIHGSGSKQPKAAKKTFLLLKAKSELHRDNENFLISEWFLNKKFEN